MTDECWLLKRVAFMQQEDSYHLFWYRSRWTEDPFWCSILPSLLPWPAPPTSHLGPLPSCSQHRPLPPARPSHFGHAVVSSCSWSPKPAARIESKRFIHHVSEQTRHLWTNLNIETPSDQYKGFDPIGLYQFLQSESLERLLIFFLPELTRSDSFKKRVDFQIHATHHLFTQPSTCFTQLYYISNKLPLDLTVGKESTPGVVTPSKRVGVSRSRTFGELVQPYFDACLQYLLEFPVANCYLPFCMASVSFRNRPPALGAFKKIYKKHWNWPDDEHCTFDNPIVQICSNLALRYIPSSFAPCAGLLHRQMHPNSLDLYATCLGRWKRRGLRQLNWNKSSSCWFLSTTVRADGRERGRDIERGTGRERLRSTSLASLSSVDIFF